MAVSNDTENTGTNSEVSPELIVEVLPGALIRVPFDSPQGVRFTQDAGSLLLTPKEGGEAILLQDFLTFGTTETPPKMQFADGQILEIGQITTLVENYSEADVSPASGDDFSAGGGANFSEYVDQGIGDPIDIADLLPPTDLAFGDDVLEEIIGENENFGNLPNDNPDGTITITYSTPGASGGSVPGGYEDWQPNQNVGDFSEAPMQVVVEFTPDSDEQLQTIDLSGFPDGARFFVGGTEAGDEVDVSSGSVTVFAAGGVLPAMYLLPPANSDADITLDVTANFINGDGFTGSTEASGTAVIDAVADIPELNGSDATGDEDTAIDIPITAALEDADGSESLAVSISGVPVGATLTDGANIFVGDGSDVDVTGWNLGALQITPPADDDSDFSLSVTAVSTESATVAGGGELTDSNNTATTSITIDVTVDPASDVPTVVVSDAAGKEDLGNAADQIAAVPAPDAGNIPLTINLTTGEGGTEDGYVVLSGYPFGLSFTVGGPDAGGWRVDQADLANLAINGLPADSDSDFSITVTPWSQDGAADPVAGTPGVIDVVIDAVADIPTLTLGGSAADADVSGDEDTAIDLPDIDFGTQDLDGSETATVSISGVPVGATLSDGNGNDFIGDGSAVDVTGWDLTALTITSATNDDTDFTLTVSVTSTEDATVAGGGEINEADNSATVSYDIDVTVDPASDVPTVVVSDAAGKEDLGNAADQIAAVPAPDAGNIPLTINLTTGEGGTEDGYVVLSGYPFGLSFTVGGPDAGGWRVDQADLANLAINGLPADSDSDFSITVTPWSQDGAADPVAGTPGVIDVVIDAVADIPTLTLGGSAADADVSGDEDTAIDLPDIDFGTQDLDGSETATVSISGVPVGATLSDGNGNDFIGDGSAVDVTGWDLTALTITSATNDDTDFTLTVSVTSTEDATVAGGGEINEADNSATVSYDINVTVGDEGPTAVADNPDSIGEPPDTHAIFVIDTSRSLNADELAEMEAALKNLATTMFAANPDGTVITLIDFDESARFLGGGDGTYTTLESVMAALDTLDTLSGGLTNYDAALDLTRTVEFEPGFEKAVYFISDGGPNRGNTPGGINQFNNWVANEHNGDVDVYAVGISDVGDNSPWLGQIDNTASDNNVTPDFGGPYLYVENPEDLSASLVTSNVVINDNVLTNDVVGNDALADIPIVSVEFNGTTYDLSSVGPDVSVDGNVLTLLTDFGRLEFNFENGDYTYTATRDVNDFVSEVFTYTITDTDGMTSSADLTVQIDPDSAFTGTGADEDIVGGSTNDYIAGMGGDDTLSGGDGDDRFAFLNAATDGNDVIEDFGTGNDVIDLTAVFDELGIDPGDRADHVLFDESGGNTTITVTDASDVEVGGFSIVVENASLNNGDIGTAIQVDES